MRRNTPSLAARLVVMVVAVAGPSLASVAPAQAHGERAQPAFLRTETIAFYDVRFSASEIRVGQSLTISGRFYVPRSWPSALPDPGTAALSAAAPGPVVLVKDARIGGEYVPQVITLRKGFGYQFRLELAGRRTGRYHIHPIVNVKGAGPLIGPGRWIRVRPAAGGGAFTNQITLRNGSVVDLESYNSTAPIAWHLIYLVPALLLLGYWLRKPLVQRLAMITRGAEPTDLITRRDVRFSAAVGVLTLALVGVGARYASAEWPGGIPLQTRHSTPPGEPAGAGVTAGTEGVGGRFSSGDEALKFTLRLRNDAREPLRLRGFATGGLVFRPQAGAEDVLEPTTPTILAPGEERRLTFTLRSHQWGNEKLIPKNEVDVAVGGVLLFSTPSGQERFAEVRVPIISSSAGGPS